MSARTVVAGILLFVPFVAVLIPQLFNKVEPTLGGLPFFVWYQLIWVVLGGILVFASYRVYNSGKVRGGQA
ncbi:hypothetical protein B9Q03_05425 [Candidatus Marsarchaeota G2 archaeon OSP_D]|jgi:hypothetical protein|uniref:DUF3311 domain-containing protein n=6 Tax=Candidatus Marsarchaeota group 2 TaxID=2203771 RepID=A0A2R6CAY5_9ARCH|nr:MAG: hypothetical protein B9Q03_05425 [Candidatus Marsarchaeota G2 archaeon OSP_D]PSN93571.1 MAG: hypothetical protein B9Q06_11710 [Candidatus Marsarchaeota G2 archaeon ECH_B_2]PSN95654.1 MAG: hypothetical protein B9Q09_02865 [Candidatus Marsarchaeota G2 archaeon ECH_B_SAG-C16]PSN97754.1 MAG: hypothetical protein B9Q07_11485 [Candidatus Marsarchaeota G2 archaeon ECH_B_3]PSO01219.1 MAG: hypothetical protein B9Q05_09080 [Candidatus Marsarchaeota G2 archaeon ECH_B_1]PSO08054.1 MAG: hypothetica